MFGIFRKYFGSRGEQVPFREKFDYFQTMLSINEDTHRSMSDLIEMIASGKPFSKGYSYRLFDSVITSTYGLAANFSKMSNGKYQDLINKVKEIEDTCYKILSPRVLCPEGWDCHDFECHKCGLVKKISGDIPYYYDISDIDGSYFLETGNKMSRLGEIRNKLGIPVPSGFCLTVRTFEEIMIDNKLRETKDKILFNVDFDEITQIRQASKDIENFFNSRTIPSHIVDAILDAFDKTFQNAPNTRLAVRSSAIGEDSPRFSFAGLHRTEMNISREQLAEACLDVLISKYSPQALVYRYVSGLRDEDMPMSVGCIEMVDAKAGGVLFTKDPNGLHENAIIHAVRGLGSVVVEGRVEPQEYIVSFTPDAAVLSFHPGKQVYKDFVSKKDGVFKEKLTLETSGKPCLSADEIRRLIDYARKIESHYNAPQDIEWAITIEGKIYILQARTLYIKNHKKNVLKSESKTSMKSDSRVLINRGECASPGIAFGEICIVNNIDDLCNFHKGSIIVARKNIPEITGIIHKAAAVVTDIGSTTGHLSIIARELNKPVITNTRNGSSVLKSGMIVTVSAEDCRVYEGRVPELLDNDPSPTETEEAFRNSPMYKIWHSLTKFIFKLNLIDPNSPDFRPENCRTLHDVIRYAHEMSMRDMFALYERLDNSTGKAYEFRSGLPVDIHIIDFGGGLSMSQNRSWIGPDEIKSKPFNALFGGMNTPGIKWSGSLPIDTRGYAGLIFRNIVDIHRAESSIGSKSYAIVSEHYLNFFSRLGYHFSRLDSFAGEDINSNYINFNFRGGAADPIRRNRRAMVIGRILERLNFTAFRQEDNVMAHIRKIPEEDILRLLTELGRLMGAVRNADITMVNEDYMEAFIDAFLGGDPAPAHTLTKN